MLGQSTLRGLVILGLLIALATPSQAFFHKEAEKAIRGGVSEAEKAVSGIQKEAERGIGEVQRGVGQVGQQVGQALKPLTQSSFNFNFRVDCSGSSAKVKPGESTTVAFNCKGGTGTVTVTALGGTGSASFETPLGAASIPVAGVAGVATVNVDIQGSLVGAVTSSGGATVASSRLTWSSYGSQSVTLQAPSTATPGTRYTVTLSPEYTATVGGSIKSSLGSAEIISFTVPVAKAPSAQATVEVVAPGPLPGFEAPLAVIGLLVMAFLWSRRRADR